MHLNMLSVKWQPFYLSLNEADLPYAKTQPSIYRSLNSLALRRCSFKYQISNFQNHIKDRYRYHELFLRYCPEVNAERHHWWSINIGSCNGLVSSGNKLLPEPVLTHIYVIMYGLDVVCKMATFLSGLHVLIMRWIYPRLEHSHQFITLPCTSQKPPMIWHQWSP